jgi:saccharopine dehydrogenase-like NADP-dependent oxidoreductase
LASKLGKRSEFVQADIHDASMLEEALNGVDLVVHAAGPFQGEDRCTVLEAAIATKVKKTQLSLHLC